MKRQGSSVGDISTKPKRTVQAKLSSYLKSSEGSKASGSKPAVTTTAIPQDFGIHVYTSKEVEGAKGFIQEYRKFWNTKAHEICKDRRLTSKMDEGSIKGAINSSWTLHKSNLLLHQARQLEEKSKLVWTDEVARSYKLKPVERNVERVKMADAHLQHLYDELSQASEGREEKELEMEKAMTELRKAQDALQKALDRKGENLDVDEKKLKDAHALQVAGVPELSEGEIKDLVEAVKVDQFAEGYEPAEDSSDDELY